MIWSDETRSYTYCHSNDNGPSYQSSVSLPLTDVALGSWKFLVGSSCISDNTLYICSGNEDTAGGMNCVNVVDSSNATYGKFSVDGSYSNLWLGYKSAPGPNA